MLFRPELLIEGSFSFSSGIDAVERWLDLAEPPDAIVSANDDMAAAALWVAHRRGLELPRDLAVAGFDDTLLATRVWPPLTTVRQPVGEMAALAVDVLLGALGERDSGQAPMDVVVDFALIERGSA
jgi:LacI family transcriptional regulator